MPRIVSYWVSPLGINKLAFKIAFIVDDYGNLWDMAFGRTMDSAHRRCARKHSQRING